MEKNFDNQRSVVKEEYRMRVENAAYVPATELTGLPTGTDTSNFPVDSVSWTNIAEFCADRKSTRLNSSHG